MAHIDYHYHLFIRKNEVKNAVVTYAQPIVLTLATQHLDVSARARPIRVVLQCMKGGFDSIARLDLESLQDFVGPVIDADIKHSSKDPVRRFSRHNFLRNLPVQVLHALSLKRSQRLLNDIRVGLPLATGVPDALEHRARNLERSPFFHNLTMYDYVFETWA